MRVLGFLAEYSGEVSESLKNLAFTGLKETDVSDTPLCGMSTILVKLTPSSLYSRIGGSSKPFFS